MPTEESGPQGLGDVVFGKYILLGELGRGGMGVVYEALDSELNRTVALKMLLTTLSVTPEEAAQDHERFLREARVSANLPKHPNIVGVYEAGIIKERRYIAMEYVQGRQMSEWCRNSTIPLRQKLILLLHVARLSITPIATASSIGTSSRRTCWWIPPSNLTSWISGWPSE